MVPIDGRAFLVRFEDWNPPKLIGCAPIDAAGDGGAVSKGVIQNDICEFESSQPASAVSTRDANVRPESPKAAVTRPLARTAIHATGREQTRVID
jgi:hypothetical protein